MSAVDIAAIDLNLLVVLDDLLRTRSTTATARRLGRTQSAVSHALGRLRLVFDDPLFVRVGAGLRPSSLADELQAPLADVLHGAAALVTRSAAGFDPARLERSFVIGGTDFTELVLLRRLVPALRREAPGVHLETRFLGDDVDRALQNREIDFAFGTTFRALAGLHAVAVGSDGLVVVLRRGHPVRRPLRVADYAALDHILVSPRGLPGSPVDDALAALDHRRQVVLRQPHFASAILIVAETDLVVTVPGSAAAALAPHVAVDIEPLPLPVPLFHFQLLFHAARSREPAHRWLRERIAAICRAELAASPFRAAPPRRTRPRRRAGVS
jgi:DNA-binding transcriptional LysR family regulator